MSIWRCLFSVPEVNWFFVCVVSSEINQAKWPKWKPTQLCYRYATRSQPWCPGNELPSRFEYLNFVASKYSNLDRHVSQIHHCEVRCQQEYTNTEKFASKGKGSDSMPAREKRVEERLFGGAASLGALVSVLSEPLPLAPIKWPSGSVRFAASIFLDFWLESQIQTVLRQV